MDQLFNPHTEAFKELVYQYQDRVLNTCYRFLHNKEDAEDMAQEVFIEVYKSLPRFRGEAQLSTWIYRIAVTKSLDFLRKKRRKKRFGQILLFIGGKEVLNEIPAPLSTNPQKNLEDREREKILQQAVDSLAENQKIAVTLNKYEEFSYKEIAEIMGMTLSSVESLIHRGMKNLNKKLSRFYERNL